MYICLHIKYLLFVSGVNETWASSTDFQKLLKYKISWKFPRWKPSFRVRLKCDGTRAETRFRLSAKRTIPSKSAGTSFQSIAGSRGVRISGSNSGYTKFRGNVKRCKADWLPTPFASFPFTSPPVRHRVPSRFNWTLPRGRTDMSELIVVFQNLANAPQNNTKANVVPGTLLIPWHHRQCLGILQWAQLRTVLTYT